MSFNLFDYIILISLFIYNKNVHTIMYRFKEKIIYFFQNVTSTIFLYINKSCHADVSFIIMQNLYYIIFLLKKNLSYI